ncbi:MAG: hypothetical protein RL497_1549 [Pseudomonadota bacterium]|jgi:methyl-accepting chemotaxis protein
MLWLNGLTLRKKLLIPIIFITSLTLFSGVMTLRELLGIDAHVKLLGNVNLAATSELLEASAEIHIALAEERSMLFLNPESADFVQSASVHAKNLSAAHDKLLSFRNRIREQDIDHEFKAYEAARDRWENFTQSVVAARKANTREGRTTAIEISFKDGNQAFQDMRAHIHTLKNSVQQRSITIVQASEQSILRSHYVVGAALGLCLLTTLITALLIPTLILSPILNMQNFVARLTKDGGDLSNKIPIQYRDEVGDLGATINEFIFSLRELIAHVTGLGSVFHNQSKMLKKLALQNSSLVNNETNEISLVVGSITQLSESVQSVAQLAMEASNKTALARSESGNGLGVVSRTINGINQLAEKVKTSSSVIAQLNTDSANIIGVVNVIKGIADQINLLALNAAIEAARAGEQGRGFAVVADSVRELAFRTAESTQEIQVMISKLQESAHLAVEAMMQSQIIAEQSVVQAGETGAALKQIDESVQRIAGVNEQISASANQQSKVAEGIGQNTLNISQFAKDGAQLALNVANASDELEKVAAELDGALRKFKTN